MAAQLGLEGERLAPLDSAAIKAIRQRHHLSQAVLAAVLNVGLASVTQWEQDVRNPSGAALKLLHLLDKKGLALFL